MKPIVVIGGTRPELIKLAPVYHQLKRRSARVELWLTGQHTSLAQGPIEFFELQATRTWEALTQGQSSNELLAKLLKLLDEALAQTDPAAVIVQGDTTSALAGALAAFHRRVPVAHVEAGLRSGNFDAPFPEEMNRKAIDSFARWHFPPTSLSERALKRENLKPLRPTGNTGIDALYWARDKVRASSHWPESVARIPEGKKLVLSTGHRRENLGAKLEGALHALGLEVSGRSDAVLVHVAHPNPQAERDAREALQGLANVQVVEALNYPDFVALLDRADLVVSDSGGIQEEAPSFGVPILITREVTERPEVLKCGGTLVGTDPKKLLPKVRAALNAKSKSKFKNEKGPAAVQKRRTPFGDGRASERIVARILRDLKT